MFLSQATYKRIEQLCLEKNFRSINNLCNEAGVAQSTVYNLTDGSTHNPSSLLILRLCRTLNITLSEFYSSELFLELEDDWQVLILRIRACFFVV